MHSAKRRAGAPVEATFTKVEPRTVDGRAIGPGVAYDYYEGAWTALPEFEKLNPTASGVRADVSLKASPRDSNYALRFHGYLEIKTPGSYTFTLGSDDGARLIIDGETALNMDGIHGVVTQSKAVDLKTGWHKVIILYFQGVGGADLGFRYEGPGVSVREPRLWCQQ